MVDYSLVNPASRCQKGFCLLYINNVYSARRSPSETTPRNHIRNKSANKKCNSPSFLTEKLHFKLFFFYQRPFRAVFSIRMYYFTLTETCNG